MATLVQRFVTSDGTLDACDAVLAQAVAAQQHGDDVRTSELAFALRSQLAQPVRQWMSIVGYGESYNRVLLTLVQRQRMWIANQLPPGSMPDDDAELRRIVALAEQGNFRTAHVALVTLNQHVNESIAQWHRATNASMAQDIAWQGRKRACGALQAPNGNPLPSVLSARSASEYYPPAASQQGYEGSVFLQVKVNEKGCATHFAIASHSGYPDLDAAALTLAEAGMIFRPGSRDGQPVSGQMVFKIQFDWRD